MKKETNYNSKDNYLVISHNYWPALGGAEKLLQSIAENLHKNDIMVDVLTSNAKNSTMYFAKKKETIGLELEIINGVLVRRENIENIFQFFGKILWKVFKMKKKLLDAIGPVLIGPHFALFLFNFIFSKKKYTHIICGPFPTSVVFYGYLMKIFSPSIKLILVPCIHICDPFHTGIFLRFVSRRADSILVLTKEETIFFKSLGIDELKITEIGVGIDTELLLGDNVDNSDFLQRYVLYMGQEVPHKNIIILIDAMVKLWQNGCKSKLVIAGAKTGYSIVIDAHIKSIDNMFQNNILRESDFNEDRKRDLIDGCNILILPSSHESFGIVFIEAWSRKKPVIGANVPAVRHLISDKKDGLLFENENMDDLALKIDYLLNNNEIAIGMGLAGYEKVIERYTWNIIINKISKI